MSSEILQYIIFASGILLTLFILLQQRGASLGAGFGGSSELFTTRRGADKTLYQLSIVSAVVFVLSIVLYLMSA